MCATYVGSPLYMAPEILKGNTYTFSVDIWAFGCRLRDHGSFVTVEHAREQLSSFPVLIDRILHHKPKMSVFNNIYCVNLVNIVKWMLAKDQHRRPTATQLDNHFAVRPPPDFAASVVASQAPVDCQNAYPKHSALTRQQEVINEARKLADAATVIQRSFRASINSEVRPTVLHEPKKPMEPIQRRKSLQSKRNPIKVTPLVDQRRAPSLARNASDKMYAAVNRQQQIENSSKVIQQAFRNSIGKRLPSLQQQPKLPPRIEKLATPRLRTPPILGPQRQMHPVGKPLQYHAPRPAWI